MSVSTITPAVPPLAGGPAAQELHDTMVALGLSAFVADQRMRQGFAAGKRDAGGVPADVMPALHRLARSLGYRVRVHDTGDTNMLGYTHGAYAPGETQAEPEFMITIQPGMSAAATARVLMHELGHVILGHAPRTKQDALSHMATRMLTALRTGNDGEQTSDECAVELAAGTVCKLAGIGSTTPSRYFLHGRLDGMGASSFYAGLLSARTLWAALRPEDAG